MTEEERDETVDIPDFSNEVDNRRDSEDVFFAVPLLRVGHSGPGKDILRTRFFRGLFRYGVLDSEVTVNVYNPE